MPNGKGTESSAMLYAVIVFAFLFIVATVLAVVYYVKAEDYRTRAVDMEEEIGKLANNRERRGIGALVGAERPGRSRVGTLLDYLDEMVSTITGEIPEESSAEMKVETVKAKLDDVLALLADEEIDVGLSAEPNSGAGLLRIIQVLKSELDYVRQRELSVSRELEDLQRTFDETVQVNVEKEQQFLSRIEALQAEADRVQQSYDELKKLMQQSADEQIQTLMAGRDKMLEELRSEHKELLATRQQLKKSEEARKYYQRKIENIKPRPDEKVAAFKPDGKIISVDNQSKTVYLNLGSSDHVYRGLTFAVYNKNVPIPEDGVGKAKIEVFDVEKNVSVARIVQSDKNNPVIPDDIIANLIWEPGESNLFVVAGDFDIDGDGRVDRDGREKIKAIIKGWAGRVSDEITVNTDFVILGTAPRLFPEPTREEMEIDPTAMDRHKSSVARSAEYRNIRKQAQELSIPIFNLDRFFSFIGY